METNEEITATEIEDDCKADRDCEFEQHNEKKEAREEILAESVWRKAQGDLFGFVLGDLVLQSKLSIKDSVTDFVHLRTVR